MREQCGGGGKGHDERKNEFDCSKEPCKERQKQGAGNASKVRQQPRGPGSSLEQELPWCTKDPPPASHRPGARWIVCCSKLTAGRVGVQTPDFQVLSHLSEWTAP